MPRQNKIVIRNGTTTPNAADFDTAEPAWDKTAGKLYIKDGAGSMVEVGGGGGGGGLTYFTEAESTTSPNGTVSVDSLTAAAATTNADVALVAKGTGATLAQVPDGTTAGGNKRGIYATDWQKLRNSSTRVASGDYSTISGGDSHTAAGQRATIGGGNNNSASGTGATVAGGYSNWSGGTQSSIGGGLSNQATSNYSFVGGGQSNKAKTSTHAAVCGGSGNDATGQYSFIGGGDSNVSSGLISSVVGGGSNNTADGRFSTIPGGRYGSTRSIQGYFAFPACNVPIASVSGVSQGGLLVLATQTTVATATILRSNTSGAGTDNQVILPNNSAYHFKGSVIATVTGGGDTAAWEFKGAIKRGANAASTAIVGTVVKDVIAYDAGASAWDVTFTADTTNGGLKVEVTGAAATTIRWVAKLETTEVAY